MDLTLTLREGGRGNTGSGRGRRIINVLVVAQIALAMVLLAGAGLMVTGFLNISTPYASEVAANTLTLTVSLPNAKYPDQTAFTAFIDRTLEKLRALPGVHSAAIIHNLPYSGGSTSSGFVVEGAPPPAPGATPTAHRQVISPALFTTLGIPLVAGRDFAVSDGPRTTPVVIINEAFARVHFPGRDPLGQRIRTGTSAASPWLTIVGVSRDVRQSEYAENVRPAFFLPHTQSRVSAFRFVLRTAGNPMSLAAAARGAVLAVDRDQPVYAIQTLQKMVSDQLKGIEFVAVFMGAFGAIALVLAAAGIYSVMANAVAERTAEIAVRMALGASERQVLGMVMGRGILLTSIGMVSGLAGAIAAARVLASLLFGTSTSMLLAYSAGGAVLAGAALLACYIPARRAMKLDPVRAL